MRNTGEETQISVGVANMGASWVTVETRAAQRLSAQARGALANVGTSRQGAVLSAGVSALVRTELSVAGMIGQGGGLTRTGSIMRDRIMTAMLDELF